MSGENKRKRGSNYRSFTCAPSPPVLITTLQSRRQMNIFNWELKKVALPPLDQDKKINVEILYLADDTFWKLFTVPPT